MMQKNRGILAFALALALLLQGVALAQGLPAAAPTSQITAPAYTRALKMGCKGADVKALQQKLAELKYYSKACDGVFGSFTESAVKAFQREHSLKADGIVGSETYKAVYGTESSGSPSGAPPRVTAPAYTRALKKGCKGADVKALQQKLAELKFYSMACDGTFGPGTDSAVKAFQKAHKLKADGIVGSQTYKAVYGTTGSSSGSGSGTGSDTGSGSSGGSTGSYTLGKLDNQVTLKRGSTGSNVKDLQAVLKMKGFYSGAISGSYLDQTKSAVMSFQHSVGLDTDGVAGNYTLSALYTMLNPPSLSGLVGWPNGKSEYYNVKIEKLQWTDASSKAFTRGLTALVIDVRTGYQFHIKRTGGTNHADVETIAPLDTAIFHKCNGNFSWARRPIWVIVGGRRLAASMNCMPHGYDSISNNDMKGQFCIHFINSRTHGTNRVDPDHQARIEEAYQAALHQPTPTPKPSASPTISPSATVSPSATASASHSPTDSPSATPIATATPAPPGTGTGNAGGDAGQLPPP